MPIVAQIAKIKALAEDARATLIRKVALDKLAALRRSHPHPFQRPARKAKPCPAHASPAKRRARFMDIDNWGPTAGGNVSIVVTVKGIEFRVVIFQYKQTPMWGWMLMYPLIFTRCRRPRRRFDFELGVPDSVR